MAREFSGRLTADDIAWLNARYSNAYVEHMKALHGVARGADSEAAQAKAEAEAREAQEKADAEAEEARLEAERQAAEEAARQAEEDLIGATGTTEGEGAGDGTYDILGATEAEVKTWAANASDEDKAAALATEQARTDREPRKGVVSLLS